MIKIILLCILLGPILLIIWGISIMICIVAIAGFLDARAEIKLQKNGILKTGFTGLKED